MTNLVVLEELVELNSSGQDSHPDKIIIQMRASNQASNPSKIQDFQDHRPSKSISLQPLECIWHANTNTQYNQAFSLKGFKYRTNYHFALLTREEFGLVVAECGCAHPIFESWCWH